MSVSGELGRGFAAARAILMQGARTHRPNEWREQPVSYHLEHARRHLDLFESGDMTELHLGNAIVRLMFAIELARESPFLGREKLVETVTRAVEPESVK